MPQHQDVESRERPQRPAREPRGSWSAETVFAVFISGGIAAWLLFLFLQWLFAQIAVWYMHHLVFAVPLSLLLLVSLLAPPGYIIYTRIDDRRQTMLDRKAQRAILLTSELNMRQGYNTKYANQVTGVIVESINPETVRPVARNVTNNNFLEGPETEVEDEDDVEQPTLEECIAQVKRNSFEVCVGRSLSTGDYRKVNIYKKHWKIIGGSQMGKSAAMIANLRMLAATHDPERLTIAPLDLEDQNVNLLADLPHIARWNGTPLVARNEGEVLDRLDDLVDMMKYRYTLTKREVKALPIVIVYIEELLRLKDHYKNAIKTAALQGPAAVKYAKGLYTRLVEALNALSGRGLKVRIQLFIAAQVDYRDEDLVAAWKNIQFGQSFKVESGAARAAGFNNNELLADNYENGDVGEFVLQYIRLSDLCIGPYFPLEDLVEEWENEQEQREEEQQRPQGPYIIAAHGQIVQQPPVRGPYTYVPGMHTTQPLGEQSNAWMIEHFREQFDEEGRAALDRLISEDAEDAENDQGEYGNEASAPLLKSPGPVSAQKISPVTNGFAHLGESAQADLPGNAAIQPVERSGESPTTNPGYPLMDETQKRQFIALYPLHGTEKSLDVIKGCAHKHREHARAIIREYNLQRKRG